jgi:hypothetical protein
MLDSPQVTNIFIKNIGSLALKKILKDVFLKQLIVLQKMINNFQKK